MLGWSITLWRGTPEERDRATPEEREAATLAYWVVGLYGLDWLTELVKAGRAEELWRSGYPSRYTALAGDVLPLFTDAAPPGSGGSGTGRAPFDVRLHPDRIAACPADQTLTIDAWDQS
ncbi:hypothetical protein QEZ40_003283 [Streptomyces katrae]|uniref:Uncharacterized protein n=1 Tax=Streptomyces katrae TaxID=68223 RepID=A0ABT7GXJ0_9ACTN|nr:hypothetical protein [Streptomyces katrae]MDK9498332.1 hypothetical protein [Streptomyces katrae]